MSKKIVLLDVDNTLLYGAQGVFNRPLIEELIQSGIRDVYLFTNMKLNDIKNFGCDGARCSRYRLIEFLNQQGLTVLGVVTPADKYCSQADGKPGAAYRTLYTPLMAQCQKRGTPLQLDDYSPVSIDYLFSELEWTNARSLLKQQAKSNGEVAISLCGLRLMHKQSKERGDFLTKDAAIEFFSRSENCATYCLISDENPDDQVVIQPGINKDTKGMMMEHFLTLPDIIQKGTTLYFFDDNKQFIDGVQAAVDSFNSNALQRIQPWTCEMPSTIEVACQQEQRLAYRRCLAGESVVLKYHFSQVPFSQPEFSDSMLESLLFLLEILAHPVGKVAAALLLIIGLSEAIVSGCLLPDVAILPVQIAVGVAGGLTLISVLGFFAGLGLRQDEDNFVGLDINPGL